MIQDMIKELLLKNRSYRRFHQNERLSEDLLTSLVELTRYCASGRNAQTLKYMIIFEEDMCEKVFKTLSWAGYLSDWAGPQEGEKPSAYIIQINDERLGKNFFCDDGIAAQSILLAAVEKDFGGCILRAFTKELNNILSTPENMSIVQVIALGKPKEEVVIDDIKDEDFKYWRDEKGVHHVPKRTLSELIIKK
jgi:nitroreductase